MTFQSYLQHFYKKKESIKRNVNSTQLLIIATLLKMMLILNITLFKKRYWTSASSSNTHRKIETGKMYKMYMQKRKKQSTRLVLKFYATADYRDNK